MCGCGWETGFPVRDAGGIFARLLFFYIRFVWAGWLPGGLSRAPPAAAGSGDKRNLNTTSLTVSLALGAVGRAQLVLLPSLADFLHLGADLGGT